MMYKHLFQNSLYVLSQTQPTHNLTIILVPDSKIKLKNCTLLYTELFNNYNLILQIIFPLTQKPCLIISNYIYTNIKYYKSILQLIFSKYKVT